MVMPSSSDIQRLPMMFKCFPLSILHDPEGKEVWSASEFHDINEVKKELELIATPN